MAHWKTYIGFFQYGEVETASSADDTRSTLFYNFYPVMERTGNTFTHAFPNPLFSFGRMQLKRLNKEYGTQANIMLEEIHRDLECNMLTAVSFDEDKFQTDPRDDRYCIGILLDSDDSIKSAIKVENFSFEDILGSSYHVLIPTDHLDLASNYGSSLKTSCVIINNPLAFSSFSCVLQCDQLLSNPVTAKISSGFHPR